MDGDERRLVINLMMNMDDLIIACVKKVVHNDQEGDGGVVVGRSMPRVLRVQVPFLLLLKIEKRRDLPNPLFRGTLPSMADLLN